MYCLLQICKSGNLKYHCFGFSRDLMFFLVYMFIDSRACGMVYSVQYKMEFDLRIWQILHTRAEWLQVKCMKSRQRVEQCWLK